MTLTKENTTRDLRLNLKKVLKNLLNPVKVKSPVVATAGESSVRGIILTVRPIEKTMSGKDLGVSDRGPGRLDQVRGGGWQKVLSQENQGKGIKSQQKQAVITKAGPTGPVLA